jgi:hypothetical protein
MKIKKYFTSLMMLLPVLGSAQEIKWPILPSTGFISGRAATQKDLEAGNAVFVSQVGNVVIGTPLKMEIPQYAYHLENGKKIPVIIVQAEEAKNNIIIGARNINGGELVGLLNEFELLGTIKK